MAGATMARVGRATVDLAVMAGARMVRVRMVLLGADRVDREIVVPTAAALAVSGADPMDLLVARMVVVPAVRMVLVAVAQDVVPMVAARVVRAEGISSSGWIRLIASSTKSCGRLSP